MMPADQPAAATIALYLRFNVAGYITVLRATDPIVPQHLIFFEALGHHTPSILVEPTAAKKDFPQNFTNHFWERNSTRVVSCLHRNDPRTF
ncbi:hypothetical protein [uncultured Parasphingorhabdus sp.]|uniref:hypothetical protein n=1 Tax=uncultured Parasphingorhabdus sp. TaxID=2709694 RepID=UPI0030D9A887|tara:strand:- start:7440 stop:7712 length:273 start_codon:yes stop_codon:yes gene_type:complete